jgi:carboxymethylenebutenolidase
VLYHRIDRTEPYGLSLPYEEASIPRGRELRAKVGWDNAVRDMAAAANALRHVERVGVIGYCWGGTLAWLGATRLQFTCAVGYYGGQIHEFVHEVPRCPVMLHVGAQDPAIPLDRVELVHRKHPEVIIHTYPGAGHSFNCDQSYKYHAPSAALSFERTMRFLAQHLEGRNA